MPLPLTVSCFSKIQIGFTFLVPAHPGSPGQRAVKRLCVCVCVCVCVCIYIGRIWWQLCCHCTCVVVMILSCCYLFCLCLYRWILLLSACRLTVCVDDIVPWRLYHCTRIVKWYETVKALITHTRAFNSPFSGTTQVSRYQKDKTNLDFTEARDSEW